MIAVMVKEWRRLVRASSTPWALLVYLLAPVGVAAVYLQMAGKTGPGVNMAQQIPLLGAQALSNIATWQILLLAVATPWISGSLLAAEVEERTLDPVLAGGGRPLGLVLGKLLAVVLFMGLVMAAGLPAFALPSLVGGINTAMLLRVVAIEMGTVALMAGLGLAISSFGRRSGSVALAGVALGLALTLGTGFAAGLQPTAVNVYQSDLMMKLSSAAPPGMVRSNMSSFGGLSKLLYANPLVGLNSALNNPGAQALTGLPGSESSPVFKQFRLWQVQVAGGCAMAVVGGVLAWAVMALRLRWHRPRWTIFRRHKAVTVDG
jgi:ABC-type transport system involved in multi-copper enzyme maturation permease subunit